MPADWAARQLADVPRVPVDEGDPDWYPLQHYFRLTAFGANAFAAREVGTELVGEHDELASGQEELYLVLGGTVAFELDEERLETGAGTVVAVRDPRVRRRAVAREAGTILLALGAPARPSFESTWRASHFEGVPQV